MPPENNMNSMLIVNVQQGNRHQEPLDMSFLELIIFNNLKSYLKNNILYK